MHLRSVMLSELTADHQCERGGPSQGLVCRTRTTPSPAAGVSAAKPARWMVKAMMNPCRPSAVWYCLSFRTTRQEGLVAAEKDENSTPRKVSATWHRNQVPDHVKLNDCAQCEVQNVPVHYTAADILQIHKSAGFEVKELRHGCRVALILQVWPACHS